MFVPNRPKIYHIVHADRLQSIIADGYLWSDAEVRRRGISGTTIGMTNIKQSRLTRPITSHEGLKVGDCVPFYFCPRSIMLYVIHMANHPELQYREGQEQIVHLEADMQEAIDWASAHQRRWAFTTSNAGSGYFRDYSDLRNLNEINWDAVRTNKWSGLGVDVAIMEGKQAEFLMECSFPWGLVSRIGVFSTRIRDKVSELVQSSSQRPPVHIRKSWYY